MDVTKTRLQVLAGGLQAGGPKPSLGGVMRDIMKNEGVTGLYAG